jgi:hypothetical protein
MNRPYQPEDQNQRQPDQRTLQNNPYASQPVHQAGGAVEYWPPPPGFPPNYTGIGVSALTTRSVVPKKSIKWPVIIGVISLVVAILLLLGSFSENSKTQKTLDQDALAKPLIVTGSGTLTQPDDSVFNMTVNGQTLELPENLYYGLTGDIAAAAATSPYYILAAYLPGTKQVIETQIYDKQGGKLLANFTEFPDKTTGYKAALKGRYDDAGFNLGFSIFAAIVLLGITGFCGWLVARRLRA